MRRHLSKEKGSDAHTLILRLNLSGSPPDDSNNGLMGLLIPGQGIRGYDLDPARFLEEAVLGKNLRVGGAVGVDVHGVHSMQQPRVGGIRGLRSNRRPIRDVQEPSSRVDRDVHGLQEIAVDGNRDEPRVESIDAVPHVAPEFPDRPDWDPVNWPIANEMVFRENQRNHP